MPRVDAVGVSSAGVFINNRTMRASLFLQVPKDLYDAKVKDIYLRAVKDTFGDIPVAVINDGDVSALAGAIIKLAPRAGIQLDEAASPAEKLKAVQALMEQGSEAAAKVYESIGVYLGHTLAFYYDLYACRHVLLLGRVMSGKGGDLILDTAKRVLAEEYPGIADKLLPSLPDERFRRVGQSMAAASLAEA